MKLKNISPFPEGNETNALRVSRALFDRVANLVDVSDIEESVRSESIENEKASYSAEQYLFGKPNKFSLDLIKRGESSGSNSATHENRVSDRSRRKMDMRIASFVDWINSWSVLTKVELNVVRKYFEIDMNRFILNAEHSKYDRSTELCLRDMFDEINNGLNVKIKPFKKYMPDDISPTVLRKVLSEASPLC